MGKDKPGTTGDLARDGYRSYSDARKVVTIAGWRVLLPAGEFTLDDMRQMRDIVDRARIRMLEKRGDLRYLGGRG